MSINKKNYVTLGLLLTTSVQALTSDIDPYGINTHIRIFLEDVGTRAPRGVDCNGQAYPYGKKIIKTYTFLSGMTKDELISKLNYNYETTMGFLRISDKTINGYDVIIYRLMPDHKINYVVSAKSFNNKTLICSITYKA
jgi:hypothetical protein